MINLKKKIERYCEIIPMELKTLQRVGALVKNQLFRFLERECSVLSELLLTVRNDFRVILEVCNGERKSTNHTKKLA